MGDLDGRYRWPHGLMGRSAAACLPRLRVQIPLGAWMSLSYEWCVLSGKGDRKGPIRRRDELYRVLCV
jgi:hypothetical protein